MTKSLVERARFRLLRALAKRGYLKRLHIGVAGGRFASPVIGGVFCSLNEPFMIDLLAKILPIKSGAFLDVGVNLGQTLAVVKTLDATRGYVGFEPNPICVQYVETLVAENEFTQCDVVPAGLGDQNGLFVLSHYSDSRVDSSASVVPEFRAAQTVVKRSIVPLCEYRQVEELGIIDDVGVVKIDVEGAELEVLASVQAMLKKENPWVLVEVLPPYSADNMARIGRMKKIESILSDIGYEIFRVKKDSTSHCAGLEWLSEFGIYDDVGLSDYVLVPTADKGLLISAFE